MILIELIKNIPTDWKNFLLSYEEEIHRISKIHEEQKQTYEPTLQILPSNDLIFNCFNFFTISQTKIVILGQDPYQNVGLPMGLCFSVPETAKMPPSLLNIFKELEYDGAIDLWSGQIMDEQSLDSSLDDWDIRTREVRKK